MAEFPLNVQLLTVGLLTRRLPSRVELYIPPPEPLLAEFPLNVQLVTVGLLPLKLIIPPPLPPKKFPDGCN